MTDRIDGLDWTALGADLLERGHARAEGVLSPGACAAFRGFWERDALFRRRIVMARHGYGEGAYAYFADPLPEGVQALREGLYRHLAPLADEAMARLGRETRFPPGHASYLAQCRAAGQMKPTPLLLRYGKGGYNRLHRDLYGDLAFPFQAVFLLSEPGTDFTGGEFLLVENRMRMQAMGEAVPLGQGDMVVFPVRDRPVAGRRGHVRAQMRHGVSRIRSGERFTLGIIFHDAA
ncbi:MAG: 2OG-Fe(II) oxygenase [Alphaproteobacteria bacterium]|nr:2OG-Fe(II) oxygenase [Alphaproteobacteria bacterium]